MESETNEIAEQLATLQDARHVGYNEAAKDPLWVWPVVGLLAGFFIASFHWDSPALTVVAMLGYFGGIIGLVIWIVGRRGVQPNMTNMPKPLRREMQYYSIGCGVVVSGVLGIGFGINWLLAGVIAFVAVSVGGTIYHLRWRTAVQELTGA